MPESESVRVSLSSRLAYGSAQPQTTRPSQSTPGSSKASRS